MATAPLPDGFLPEPKMTANGRPYRGRFTCSNVQWTGESGDLFATFTITATELADAAQSRLLWTDQDVQRGVRPDATPAPARELCLADGYPDQSKYVFSSENADEMVEKLLYGKTLFLNPLVWNLRPRAFKAYRSDEESAIYLYEGNIYLPDSHHRQQAIIKAVSLWRSAPSDYRKFSGDRQFKIELYFLSREDEGNYFFDKNQRPKPTAKSKAYDLTTQDDLSLLAKLIIEKSTLLSGNVNRVTDRLSKKNPQVVTLATVREMGKSFTSLTGLDESELEGLASVASTFFDMLGSVRSELGHRTSSERTAIRENSLVDAGVMMHGYAALMSDFHASLADVGSKRAEAEWRRKLERLSQQRVYHFGTEWHGDLFEKSNPLWQRLGVLKPSRAPGRFTVTHTGATRASCAAALRQLLAAEPAPTDISFLAVRS